MAISINHLTSNVTLQVTQPYLVVDDEGLKAFAVGVQGPPSGATVALAGLTDVDNAAVPTNQFFVVGDGTKFVTRGILGDDLPTIPLDKLSNLTTSNLDANAGILSSQIAALDASKLSGTFPLSLLNQGTTGQFLRGDGTYSNTLTGPGLNLILCDSSATAIGINNGTAGASDPTWAGLTTGARTLVPDLRFVASDVADTSMIGHYLGSKLAMSIFRGNSSWNWAGPKMEGSLINWRIYPVVSDSLNCTGAVYIAGNQGLVGPQIRINGTQAASLAGYLQLYGTRIEANGPITASGAGGLLLADSTATTRATISSTGLAVTGAISATTFGQITTTSGNLIMPAAGGSIMPGSSLGSDSGFLAIYGGNGATVARGGAVVLRGLDAASNPGGAEIYTSTSSGSARITVQGTVRGNFSATGLSVTGNLSTTGLVAPSAGVIYGAAGTTTAAQNEIVGTSTGLKSNVSSGLYHELLAGGSRCAQFGRGGLGVSGAGRFSLGGWGTGATYDNTQFGFDATTNSGTINIGTSGQFQVWNAGSANPIIRIGYTTIDGGVSSVEAWAIGKFGAGAVASQAGIASSGDGSLTVNITSVSGSQKWMAQGVLRRSQTAIGGVIIADLGDPVVLANSTTTALMTATSRYGLLRIFNNTGQFCYVRVNSTGTLTIESQSGNFALTASPTASQLGLSITAGTLNIITGSAATTTISASFEGL